MKTIEAFLSDLRQRDINLWLDGNDLCYKAPSQTLTPALRQELKERKAEILTFLHNANATTRSNLPPILPAPRDKDLPLSFAQQRLWFLNQLEPNSSAYNMPAAYRLTGQLNITALEQSLNEIIRRHEVLRMTFPAVNGQPSQAITPSITLTLPLTDLGEHPETEREVIAQQIATEEAQQPFNLAQEPLFRAKLLRLTEAESVLLLNMHHIISDGWSFDIFFQELATLYSAFSTNKPSSLPELPIQYADFAYWQREWLQDEVIESQLSYWRQQLSGSLPILQLPTDHPRPPVQTYRGKYQSLKLPLNLTKALKALSQQEAVTLFMTLLAAFQTLLSRYSGQEDIIVGIPIAGRNQVETEGLIGLFVNSLAIRTNLSINPSFRQLLSQVREVTLEAYDHQDLPLEKLIEELKSERDLSRSPLFQVMFVFQNTPSKPWELPGLTITPLEVHSGTSKFDLILALEETSEGIKGGVEYNTDLFEAATITRMVGHFQTLLESIVANPQQRLSDLPLLTAAEQHQLLVEWNNSRTNYPSNTCIHQLFEVQAEQTPNAVAAVFGSEQLTYQQLNHRANQLAHHLQGLRVGSETCVGICVERSLDILVGLLGILKAGAAYLPLDPAYPQERLTFMLEDAQVPVLLTQQRQVEKLPSHRAKVVCLDTDWDAINRESQENPISSVTADNLAYVMYTSGSTGRPKGVSVIHRGVVRLVKEANYANLSAEEVFLQLAPISFDASTLEIWGSLLNGALLVIFPPHTPSLEELGQVIQQYQITTLWLTASLFHLMVDERLEDLKPLRQLLAGGDVLSVPHVQKFLQKIGDCKLINGYGPTENTTFTCCYPITEPDQLGNSVPIGRPITNTQVYLLDSHLQPVPIGVPGELYIGGDGLARGYLNRPDLTEEKFIPNPFPRSKGAGDTGSQGSKEEQSSNPERLYKTGDLARYLPDGNIEFLGRIDNQVKIRGFRIELGEVESTLSQYPAVRQCAVIARIDTDSDKRLVAYIVADQQQKPTTDELRRFLKQKLPDYMVPSAFVFPDALPLTPNGKIDRRALPAPDQLKQEPGSTFVPPSDDLEIQLTKIWENVLGKKPIGVKDNFFDLGGHSLLAVRLFAQIEKSFGKNLPLATLFQAPNIEELANILRQKGWSVPWQTLVAIQPGGSKPPLFCIHPIGGNVLCYRDLAHYLGQEQPVYGLQAIGLDGKQAPYKQVEDMAAHYIREIRALQPEGSYLLAGYSGAGIVAFEIAQQLVAGGQKVAVLALLDAYSPQSLVRKLPPGRSLYINFFNLLRLRPEDKLLYLKQKAVWLHGRITRKIAKTFNLWMRRPSTEDSHPYALITEAFTQAITDYVPQVYPGQATLFRTRHQPTRVYYDPLFGWGSLVAGGLEICDVPGLHFTLLKEPCVQVLGEKLRACIDEALEDVLEGHTSEPKKSTTEVE
jgi:amino acid adenylation domain-containing protein